MAARHVDVGDTRLWVDERGSADLALIALHAGPGLDHTVFGPWLDPLAERLRLVLVDLRGHGHSEFAPPQSLTLARMARDVDALARELGAARFVVLGHSLGALVALRHAIAFPGRAVATVLAGAVASGRRLDDVPGRVACLEPPEARERVRGALARLERVATPAELRSAWFDLRPLLLARPDGPVAGELQAAMHTARYAPAAVEPLAHEVLEEFDVTGRLEDVAHPVLVLVGGHDRVAPLEAAQELAAGLPQAHLVMLEGCGHLPHAEDPVAFRAVVRSFVSRHAD